MARTREFDPDQVLERAMRLFWLKGYSATSISDLVEHLGIGRASLYATFGTKHELYLAALDRYIQQHDPDVLELLAMPGPVLPAIRALLEGYLAPPPADDPKGCMVVNAAVECPPDDHAVRRRIDLSWGSLETALTSALLRARAQGEVAAGADAAQLARFLMVLMQGMRVTGSAEGGARRAGDAAILALRTLGSPTA